MGGDFAMGLTWPSQAGMRRGPRPRWGLGGVSGGNNDLYISPLCVIPVAESHLAHSDKLQNSRVGRSAEGNKPMGCIISDINSFESSAVSVIKHEMMTAFHARTKAAADGMFPSFGRSPVQLPLYAYGTITKEFGLFLMKVDDLHYKRLYNVYTISRWSTGHYGGVIREGFTTTRTGCNKQCEHLKILYVDLKWEH